MEADYPSWWVSGHPNDDKDRQRQMADRWYKFRFQIKSTQCTTSEAPGTIVHNKKTDSIMTVRYGKNWYLKFEKSVDSLYTTDSLAIAIAKQDARVKRYMPHIIHDKHFSGDGYTSLPTPNANQKVVLAEGQAIIYGDTLPHASYLRILVDLRSKKVVKIEDTVYGY